MAYAALPRFNFFDSRRKGSTSYVLHRRLAPASPARRLEAGRPGSTRWSPWFGRLFFCVAHRLIGQREADCRPSVEIGLSAFGPFGGVGAQRLAQKHFAEDWWIMTLTTEIQANIDDMVAQARRRTTIE